MKGVVKLANKNYFSVKEIADLFGVSAGLIYAQVKRGDIPSLKIGRRILIPTEFIEKLTAPN